MLTRKTVTLAVLATLALIVPLAALRPVAKAATGPAARTWFPVGPLKKVARGLFEVQGVRIRAQAYVDHKYNGTPYRCALGIAWTPPQSSRWGLTYTDYWGTTYPDMVDIEQEGMGVVGGPVATADLEGRRAVLHPHLHQYDIYEERVTFHDLHIARSAASDPLGSGFGFLTITRPLTATTPSGITVTLPVQDAKRMTQYGFSYNGPPGVTFLRVILTPGRALRTLPNSPLYRRHHIPISVDLTTAPPVFMNSRLDDEAQPRMTITPPGKNATHLDSLTLIVHQRADLQDIPLALPVSVDRHLASPFY